MPCAPVKMDTTSDARLQHVPQYRLQRRKPRAAGDHEDRTRTVAVDELPDRSFDAQQRAAVQGWRLRRAPEDALGKSAAQHAAHVQLDELAVVRGAGDGEAA